MFLDLMEEVMQNINVRSQRPRIEHSQIIAPDDFSRMGKVGGELCILFRIEVSISFCVKSYL